MNPLRVASVQMESAPLAKQANLEKMRGLTLRAVRDRAQVVVFPELCTTGYLCLPDLPERELRSHAEPVPDGPSTRFLLDLAKAHGITIGAGVLELDADGALYNTFAVAMSDGSVRRHRKLQAFESDHIRSGSDFTVFDTPHGWKFGVLICYDNNLVENVRIARLKDAQLLLAPHQTGGCDYKRNRNIMGLIDRKLWENRKKDPEAIEAEFKGPKGRGWLMTWLPARAHDNGLFIAFSNGVGVDGPEIRTGNAMLLDPFGRVLRETWKADDDVVVADLDPALLQGTLGDMFIRTRRPELYGPLLEKTGREMDTRKARFDAEYH